MHWLYRWSAVPKMPKSWYKMFFSKPFVPCILTKVIAVFRPGCIVLPTTRLYLPTRKRKHEFLYIEESTIYNVPDEVADSVFGITEDEGRIILLTQAIDRLTVEEKALITLFLLRREIYRGDRRNSQFVASQCKGAVASHAQKVVRTNEWKVNMERKKEPDNVLRQALERETSGRLTFQLLFSDDGAGTPRSVETTATQRAGIAVLHDWSARCDDWFTDRLFYSLFGYSNGRRLFQSWSWPILLRLSGAFMSILPDWLCSCWVATIGYERKSRNHRQKETFSKRILLSLHLLNGKEDYEKFCIRQ